MFSHDRFLELGALAVIGQVSASEQEELSQHLRECAGCREAYSDYTRILRQQLPQADSVRFRVKSTLTHPSTETEIRERFLARARASGANISHHAEQQIQLPVVLKRIPWRPVLATTAALLVIIILGAWFSREFKTVPQTPPPSTGLAGLIHQNELLRAEVSHLTESLAALSSAADAAKPGQKEAIPADVVQVLQAKLADSSREIEQLNSRLQQLRQENSGLSASSQHDQTVIADLRSQVDKLQAASAGSVAAIAELQERIQGLGAELKQERDRVEIHRQLASVSTDVRQLMGARSLHIIDVHDVNGAGKSAKSFGRVFYSEGQSLVFYAFDLPNGKLSPAKYYFKAWGQQEGRRESVHNLGTFAVDDHDQRRWVLKVNNAALLSGIDSVFVTAESTGDFSEPRGKRILYAYLAGQPNHP